MLSVGDRSCIKTVLKMTICFPIRTYTNSVLRHSRVLEKQMSCNMCRVVSQAPSSSCCLIFNTGNSIKKYSRISLSYKPSRTSNFSFRAFQRGCSRFWVSTKRGHDPSLTVKSFVSSAGSKKTLINFSSGCKNASVRMLLPERRWPYNVKCKFGPFGFSQASVSAGLISGLLVCYASSDSAYAEVPHGKGKKEDDGPSSGHMAHGKKVYTDYSVIGIPGDGRCLFRSVAYGACLRSGRAAPSESLQRQLADELRAMVADEFVRRQEETEWFIEGDFDSYVSQIRKPHVWGGEPELLMLSHVLRMPITVYMRDEKAGGLISIAEYGQEYDKENPIRVLYHGFGHYDALLIPGKKGAKSRL